MKPLTTFVTIISISFIPLPSWSETFTKDDLVEKTDAYCRKFTDFPSTREISSNQNGKIKNGRKREHSCLIMKMVSCGPMEITKMKNEWVVGKSMILSVLIKNRKFQRW